MANLSNFPQSIDTFVRHYEISATDVPYVARFQELKLKTNRSVAEENELANLTAQLREKLISADDFNKFQDALVNMETFIKSGVEGYILAKQTEYNTALTSATGVIQTQKDSALSAIEAKKDGIITYLDGTTAGALRNDIGVMADLSTTNKTSLVGAVNEVSQRGDRYGVTTNSSNTYSVTVSPTAYSLFAGLRIGIKINAANTGSATINVNGLGAKTIKKSNGNTLSSGNLKTNSVYTLVYDGTDFILQGEGGGGTAIASQVRAGTTFSNDMDTEITGTLPVQSTVAQTITPTASNIVKAAGIYDGAITVAGVTVPASSVLVGTTIAGTAGTMPNNGAVNRTPTTSSQSIPAGYTTGGTVSAVSVPVANVLTGTTIAGAAGTMPNRGSVVLTPGTSNVSINSGYHSGSGYVKGYADSIASNIRSGKIINDIAGTLIEGKRETTANMTAGSMGYAYTNYNASNTTNFAALVINLDSLGYVVGRITIERLTNNGLEICMWNNYNYYVYPEVGWYANYMIPDSPYLAYRAGTSGVVNMPVHYSNTTYKVTFYEA